MTEISASARPLAEKKGLPLVVEVAPGIGAISSDRRRVGQILMNSDLERDQVHAIR